MEDETFLANYFNLFQRVLEGPDLFSNLIAIRDAMVRVNSRDGKVMLAGNGASASIASHFALDFTKQGKIRAVCFNDSSLVTAYSNDYGYENWVAKAIEHYGQEEDLAILISSSGNSSNMVNAAYTAREKNIFIVTLTGFESDNPLKALGDINLWLDCCAYNIVESTHAFWLGAICDLIIGKIVYNVND
jgi:D-sedoheptulose 7-phosphate isomerase